MKMDRLVFTLVIYKEIVPRCVSPRLGHASPLYHIENLLKSIQIRERITFDSEKYLIAKIQLPKTWNYLFNRPEPGK